MYVDPRLIMQMMAIAEHGSISKAAAALRLSQPALSNGIASLERRLGVRLLVRSRQGSTLTNYGMAVARCASAMDSHILSLLDDIKAKASGGAGTLNIGVTPIVAATVVPEAIAELMARMPNLTMSVKEALDDQLLELTLQGKIDLSICPIGMEAVPRNILEQGLFRDPFAVVVSKGHRLARSNKVSLADIFNEPWILPHKGSAFRRQVEAMFLTAGLAVPTNSVNTNSRGMIEKLLLLTDRVAIMSEMLINSIDASRYVRIKLTNAGAPRTIGIKRLSHVKLSPQASLFLEVLQEMVGGHNRAGTAEVGSRRRHTKSARKAS